MQERKSHKTFDGNTKFWTHESKATKASMNFSTFVPKDGAHNALIWLSGLTCTEENFITKSGIQALLSETKTMVICPDTSPRSLALPGEDDSYDFGSGASFYLNARTPGYRDHYQMYDYINEEIPEILRAEFGVKKMSLFGHSMGGHGALVIGLKNPERFASLSAFSPVVNPVNCIWGEKAFKGYLGEQSRDQWKEYDATELIKEGFHHPRPIFIDQGTNDGFLDEQLLTKNFESACGDSAQDLELHFREGYDHSYFFISTFLSRHVRHHLDSLNS